MDKHRGAMEGMTVRSMDGHKLGTVIYCGDADFQVEKGLFFPKEYTASYDDIAEIKDGELYLGRSSFELAEGRRTEMGRADSSAELATERDFSADRAELGREDQTTIPVAEEELETQKRMKQAGEIRVNKTVKTEEKTVKVPVMKEEVRVESVPGDYRELSGEEKPFRESTTTIPIHEEEVEVRKRPVVKEEVRISKQAREDQETIRENVRKEDVDVERSGNIDLEEERELLKKKAG